MKLAMVTHCFEFEIITTPRRPLFADKIHFPSLLPNIPGHDFVNVIGLNYKFSL